MEKDKDSVDDLVGDLPGVVIDESTPYLFEIAWEVANRGELSKKNVLTFLLL